MLDTTDTTSKTQPQDTTSRHNLRHTLPKPTAMTGVRIDQVADFMDLRGMKNSLAVFYSTFSFTPYENGDVMIGSANEPRIVMIPHETQTDAFRAALERKLATLPPPHYDRPHPLGSDLLLSKMAPKMKIMTRAEYILWQLRRLSQDYSHVPNSLMLMPCEIHQKEVSAGVTDVKSKTTEVKTKKKRRKKKKGKRVDTEASTDATCSTPPSSRATSGWSTVPNTPTSSRR
ncbi:YALI0E32197p [Yarrowia lipolytica CLIB122]|uniref:YALI0E32197p n=2 Tax=Yarrowia lipolytica TaxID=4952 RepID=Q6C3T8_YARLI|nr:YALI0E32197p [Yarrowia lipolytica CLIB122]CAG80278.1 YALI0E32197p [Yarrowia lipolytica CLIB122]|eukprot:XP_504674.1 YALI0E32197p [Yarrowia lipolytica CLIB122]